MSTNPTTILGILDFAVAFDHREVDDRGGHPEDRDRDGYDGPLAAAARAARRRLARLATLDGELDAAPPGPGAAATARLEERDGLARTLGLPLRATPAHPLAKGTMIVGECRVAFSLPAGRTTINLEATTIDIERAVNSEDDLTWSDLPGPGTDVKITLTGTIVREPGEDEPPFPDALPLDHVVLEATTMLDGRISQTVLGPHGEYERIVSAEEAGYGKE